MKVNKKLILNFFIVIMILISVVFSLQVTAYNQKNEYKEEENIIVSTNEIEVENIDNNIDTSAIEAETATPPIEEIKMYATTAVHIRKGPSIDTDIITTIYINTEVTKIGEENGWTKIKQEENIYYIKSDYLSLEKTEIKPKVTSRGGTTERKSTTTIVNTTTINNKNKLTKSKGVNYFNGHKETYYSQKVLPGGGLKIPGRHVASDGTIRDENNYICVASNDYKKGAIVETSLGTGKVYDSGCASGTIDIYTDWD